MSVITDPKARAAAEPFVKAMKDKYGRTDNAQASRAWDSTMMMVAAMKKAGHKLHIEGLWDNPLSTADRREVTRLLKWAWVHHDHPSLS